MRAINKGEPPSELAEYLLTPGVTYAHAPLRVKSAMRAALHRDQFGLCAYCCASLSADSAYQQIDHLVPQSVDPSRTLDWENLLLSCASGRPQAEALKRSDRTCDDHKADDELPVHPLQLNCEQRFAFVFETGQIHAGPADLEARRAISVVNLDCLRLRKNRSAAMEEAASFLDRLGESEWSRRFLAPRDGALLAFEPAVRTLLTYNRPLPGSQADDLG